jgi:cyclophilin family peptidyl-prolyl cis-trans isomerase
VSLAVGQPPSQRDRRANRTPASPRRSKHQRRQRLLAVVGGVTLLAVVLGTVAAGFLGRSDETSTSTSSSSSTTPVSAEPAVELVAPPAGAAITGETPCPAADGSSPRTTSFENPPPTCIDPARRYRAVIETTKGPITVLLNTDQAPGIVNNFVVLSRYHFYDGVPFFSIVPQKFIATGDATGDPLGTGGPGYTVPDEIPEAGVIFPWGTLAMAGGQGQPDANGSTFLIASGDDAADLPPVLTVFGQVLDGADAVNAIDEAGSATTGQPTEDIRIESVTILEE